ncbi:MAG: Trk family potassium uptake protein, partial [Clostridia bacterium]|nr:Trk family potassium uptake protein [Clostridia bacterium]
MKSIKLKPVQVLAIGFFSIILLGTFVLCMPVSSKTGQWTSFFNSMFTSTSATCVTGLVVKDTGSYWSLFGQTIIILLIQIGGIGFMTIATLFSIAFGKKISLKQRGVLQESVNIDHPGGIIGLTKRIIKGTLLVEFIGAFILAVRFSFDFGVGRGIFYGVFHSISAFCNAGFDLFGAHFGEYSSLTHYKDDFTVNITISTLIIIGGIGFL